MRLGTLDVVIFDVNVAIVDSKSSLRMTKSHFLFEIVIDG